jgi:hypothetical protein
LKRTARRVDRLDTSVGFRNGKLQRAAVDRLEPGQPLDYKITQPTRS